ncbi:MAG: hypothetical protein ACTSQ8_16740 [Candidatus Helarchaeota archaeon]
MSDGAETTKNLEDQIKKLQKELEFSKERVTKLEKELASTKSSSMKYEREVEDLNKKNEQLTLKNTELKQEITDLEQKIIALGTEALEKELKESKELIANQNQKITELEDQISHLSKELTETRSIIKAKDSELNVKQETLNSLTTEIQKSEELIQEKEESIKSLNSTIETIKKELTESQAQISILKSRLDEDQAQIGDATDSLITAQSAIQERDTLIQELKSEIENLNSKIKEQKNRIHELQLSSDKKDVEFQELSVSINDLEKIIDEKSSEIEKKAEKIEELIKKLENAEAGVNLYQNTIKELKIELEKRDKELQEVISQKEAPADIKKYEQIIETKDKTINILKREISDLNAKLESLKSSEPKTAPLTSTDARAVTKKIMELIKSKLSETEQNSILAALEKNDNEIKELQSLFKKQKSELSKKNGEIESFKSEIKKNKSDINKLKSDLKDKDKFIKKLEKELTRSKKIIEDLESEVDLESAISQVEKRKKVVARIEEDRKLRDRIDNLEENLEWEKQQFAELKKKYEELLSTSDAQAALEQKKTYESYILTLQTELYDIKHQLETSERLRSEQQVHIDRLEAIIAQIQVQMDQPIEPDILNKPLVDTSPPILKPSQLFSEDPVSKPTPSEPLIEPPSDEPLLGTHVETPILASPDSAGLLTNRPLSPEEQLEQERNTQLMEIFAELSSKFDEIKDMAFAGYSGEVYFQTSTWDIKDELFKLIQDWKAEAPAVWINKMKYATIKATEDSLVATNVQGKGHLLCAPVDEKLFMICFIDIKGDALLLYEDLKVLLPHIKNIFDAYEQRKTKLL